jgi:tetratricopeptide (TPR) repeat protein
VPGIGPAALRETVGILSAVTRSLAMALVLAAWAPALAQAQLPQAPSAPSEDDVARARARFVEGMTWAQAGRWEAALDAFEASYALSGSPVALFNLAGALRELGRSREAREAFDRLLVDPALDADLRARTAPLRAEVAAQVARVRVEGVPAGEARVLADGAERETTARRPVEVELDPGARALAIEVAARRWDWAGTLAPGVRLELTASFREPALDPLPWALLGVGLAAVAAALVTALVLDAEAQLDPRTALVIRLP